MLVDETDYVDCEDGYDEEEVWDEDYDDGY